MSRDSNNWIFSLQDSVAQCCERMEGRRRWWCWGLSRLTHGADRNVFLPRPNHPSGIQILFMSSLCTCVYNFCRLLHYSFPNTHSCLKASLMGVKGKVMLKGRLASPLSDAHESGMSRSTAQGVHFTTIPWSGLSTWDRWC